MKIMILPTLAAVLLVGVLPLMAKDSPKAQAVPKVISPPWSKLEQISADYEAMLKRAEAKRVAKEERARVLGLFEAVVYGDLARFRALLQSGVSPDSEMPFPPPDSFKKRYGGSDLAYYINTEPGFTVLMLAAMLGRVEMVDALMTAGANPWKTTRKDKTFALWLAGHTQQIEVMRKLMKIGQFDDAARCRIDVDINSQMATLYKGDKATLIVPVSTGKESTPTPKGRYLVTNKYRDWTSTKYHAKMPFFLRLSCGDFGLHAGYVPGFAASHGCIRVPAEKASELFVVVPIGTLVEIR